MLNSEISSFPRTGYLTSALYESGLKADGIVPWMKRHRSSAFLAACAIVLAVSAIAALEGRQATLSASDTFPSAGGPRTYKVVEAPIEVRIDAVGTLSAASRRTLGAPFDGYIKRIAVNYGDRVEDGDVLLVMDDAELKSKLREAEIELLKAKMAHDSLSQWNAGPEVARARRALASAQQGLTKLRQQQTNTKVLLDKGIVSKDEYDGILQQEVAQENSVASAQQDFDEALHRGDADNVRVAELALKTAQARIDDLNAQSRLTVIKSPLRGVVMHPPPQSSHDRSEARTIEPGVHVSRGEALLLVGGLDQLSVEAHVDEDDIGKIRVGQKFTVEGNSFPGPPIPGTITMAALESDEDGSSGSLPRFTIRGAFSVDESRRSTILIGMSARVSIVTYSKPVAIVIPNEAVRKNGDRLMVETFDNSSGDKRLVPVQLGVRTPQGLEVTSGLSPGATIVFP